MSALYDNREHSDVAQKTMVKNVREVLAKDFQQNYMMTGTRVKYAKKAGVFRRQTSDKVIHDCDYAKKREQDVVIVGSNGFITDGCGYEKSVNALFGTDDMSRVEQVCARFTGEKPHCGV